MKLIVDPETEVVNALLKEFHEAGAYWMNTDLIREVLYRFGAFVRKSTAKKELVEIPGIGIFKKDGDSINKARLKKNQNLKKIIQDKNLPKASPKNNVQED